MKQSLHYTQKILAIFISIIPFVVSAQWTNTIITPNSNAAGLNENANQCLAVSGDTLHVAYWDHRSNGWAIYYMHSLDSGMTWSTPVAITDTNGKASDPSIAAFGSTVHVVWMDSINGHRCSKYIRSLDGGNTWGAPVMADSATDWWPGVATYDNLVIITINKIIPVNNSEVFIIRSLDNGNTWLPEQQVSTAQNRSEDPAITIHNNDVHLSWNDKRSGVMEIYYCHSSDGGATWGNQTALSNSDSYSSMVCYDINNPMNIDVPFGNTTPGHFSVFLTQSADMGATWSPMSNIVSDTSIYPYEMRIGSDIYMCYLKMGTPNGPRYMHSPDGGTTWDSMYSFGPGGMPFIGHTGCALHVIYSYLGKLHYSQNLSACGTVGMSDLKPINPISLYPNPNDGNFTLAYHLNNSNGTLRLVDVTGRVVHQQSISSNDGTELIDASKLNSGIYYWELITDKTVIDKGKIAIIK